MNILLFGKDGQLGWELQRSLTPLGKIHAFGRGEVDLNDGDMIKNIITRLKPSVIINAAAYTAVDKAEQDQDNCFAVNTDAVSVMAEEAQKRNALLVHYSTDYVFDGKNEQGYSEDDIANPLNIYGKSKYQGERAVQQSGADYLIFRTSWMYATRGENFARTILKLAGERQELQIVNDQYGAPTSAELIADITALALYKVLNDADNRQKYNGIYHLTAAGSTNWFDYASYVLKLAGNKGMSFKLDQQKLSGIPAEQYPAPAKRPKNSYLNTDKIKSVFGIHLPDWQYHVQRLIEEGIAL